MYVPNLVYLKSKMSVSYMTNKTYSSQKYALHNWDASICTMSYPNFKKVTFEKKVELKLKKKNKDELNLHQKWDNS